ncbi:hypothetical protein JOC95_002064 [Bacillus tianshenii]|uniref:DUF1659 domain-containing protein n=1 Tax=Sutcliffiella tianshenii TaxID=1463404 RepID=A0ABS2P006_9BACI|nr:DUF1659 domain-containing protein [Bacillus tianshenii]MBM7620211.1 hypothetical protein [Bacillus tianshenii]MCA1322465.1 DUF1659 domain-containing protein [Bacillus tianshenii]
MAEVTIENSQLRLVYELGDDENGKMQFRTKNYNNIKVAATADGLLAAGFAISGLQNTPVSYVKRNDLQHLG